MLRSKYKDGFVIITVICCVFSRYTSSMNKDSSYYYYYYYYKWLFKKTSSSFVIAQLLKIVFISNLVTRHRSRINAPFETTVTLWFMRYIMWKLLCNLHNRESHILIPILYL